LSVGSLVSGFGLSVGVVVDAGVVVVVVAGFFLGCVWSSLNVTLAPIPFEPPCMRA